MTIPTLLKSGTQVITRHGNGIIVKIDMDTYSIPMYYVLLTDRGYEDEIMYISDPRITPEISQLTPTMTTEEVDRVRAELEFDTMRDLVTGTVTCRQCATQYHEIDETDIVDIETDTPGFHCVKCWERL